MSKKKSMRDKYIENIIRSLEYKNANKLEAEGCYILCANKEKLTSLESYENLIIFGRRGTGKTTLFKAFTYYIENISKKRDHCCVYLDLESFFPSDTERQTSANDGELSLSIIRHILFEICKYLEEKANAYVEATDVKTTEDEENVYSVLEHIDLMYKYVFEGAKYKVSEKEVETTCSIKENSRNRQGGLSVNLSTRVAELKAGIGLLKKRNENTIYEMKKTEESIYALDTALVRKTMESLLQMIRIQKLYICIDEFTQVDKDLDFTIQPKVGQLLKQLFFISNIFSIKIASVWSENRIQNRQLDGNREGIEIGHDIFVKEELKLDEMFLDENEKAIRFFKRMILNEYLLFGNKKSSQQEQRRIEDDIIKTLFAKDSFKYLVCGSQGVPRTFARLLEACINEIKECSNGKITPEIVFNKVIDDYRSSVRSRLPYAMTLCGLIEEYTTRTKQRYFLVKIKNYKMVENQFAGLVGNEAIQQIPSDRMPRKIRNKYKLFYVHYGNYLEAVGSDSQKGGIKRLQIDTTKEDGVIFPNLPDEAEYSKYILDYEVNDLQDGYCTNCRKYIDKAILEDNNKCPYCGKIII